MQARNDVRVRRDDFTATLRRILPRGRPAGHRVKIGPAGADMLRLACGPSQEHFPIVAGCWCDVAEAGAAVLRAIAATSPPILRLVLFDGVLAVNGTTLAAPKRAVPGAGPLAPPLADLPLFAYRPRAQRAR
jgi:hypothetical protein